MIHSFPFYIADWRDSTARMEMTPLERLLYMELFIYAWKEGDLPQSEAALTAISGLGMDDFNAAWPGVRGRFAEIDGRLRHHKVDEKRPEVEKWHLTRREAGRRGGISRAQSLASAKAQLQAQPLAQLQAQPLAVLKPSSSSSTSTTTSPHISAFDDLFDAIWNAYPAKGRTRRPMCEGYYSELMTVANGDAAALHQQILAPLLPGGKWERSKTWGSGYVFALADYLANRRWQEEPEPRGEWD